MYDPGLDTPSFWQRHKMTVVHAANTLVTPSAKATAVIAFFIFEIFCITFLQKFVLPINLYPLGIQMDVGSIELPVPLTYLALIALFLFVRPTIDLVRVGLVVLFFGLAIFSTLILTNTYSVNSMLLLIAIYLPFVLTIDVRETTYRRMIKLYLDMIVIVGVIVFAQHIVQLTSSFRAWPNLDKIVSQDYLFQNYNYIQPIKFGSRLMKPNAVVFLEVSFISQWAAVAFALELIYFKRAWRLMFYAILLVALFAGTGLFLLLLTAPVLLTGISRKSLLTVAVVLAVSVFFASEIHWNSQVNQRFTEYQMQRTSSYKRFIEPFLILQDFSRHPGSLIAGEGPGSGDKSFAAAWWPMTKISYEYGFLAAASYLAMIGYTLFSKAPSRRFAFVLMVMFNFMGAAGVPVYAYFILLLGGLFRIREPKPGYG